MKPRAQTVLAWALLGATLAGVLLYWFLPAGTSDTWEGLDPLAAAFLAMSLVGATIVWRTGGNRVGWVMVAIGAIALISAVGSLVGERASAGGSTGWAVVGFLVGDIFFIAAVVCTVVILPLVFPTGRPPTPGWSWLAWGAVGVVVFHTALTLVQPTLNGVVSNPLGMELAPDYSEGSLPETMVIFGILAGVVLAAASLVVRFRKASGVERKQLSWLTFAMALVAVAIVSQEIAVALGVDVPDAVENASIVLAVLVFPIAIGIAVLRYRLYEIDRLVRRTVSYAVVAVLLALVYLGGVAALGALVGSENPLAVAGATLAAAALFNPLRRRVQRWVDRRFDRGRYDAARVVEGFSARLRDEVDLEGSDHSTSRQSSARPAPGTISVVLVGEELVRRAALVVWLASIVSWLAAVVYGAYAPSASPVLEAVELFAFVILGTFGYLIVRRQPNQRSGMARLHARSGFPPRSTALGHRPLWPDQFGARSLGDLGGGVVRPLGVDPGALLDPLPPGALSGWSAGISPVATAVVAALDAGCPHLPH